MMDSKQIAVALIVGFLLFVFIKYEVEPWFYDELCKHDIFKSCESVEFTGDVEKEDGE